MSGVISGMIKWLAHWSRMQEMWVRFPALGAIVFIFITLTVHVKVSLFCLTPPLEHIDFSYHRLLDVKHMVLLTYFFRGNQLSPQRLLVPISSKGSFIMHFPGDSTAHTTAFDGPVVDHCLERKIAQTANESAIQD